MPCIILSFAQQYLIKNKRNNELGNVAVIKCFMVIISSHLSSDIISSRIRKSLDISILISRLNYKK